ncbi:MAG: carbon starvation protein CstA [Candidatus Schekmanbacteria bacterium RIFCSPLOWO2_12_FULL_38_15]|uniref:Carbon starvation protein CstA n=1 Tax=Candidatus Schekmanbacteria bacterium RIFCSPLOWO2_12_FULL_38_15 TaxID=1817883 RepID=A0A1F7SGW6_9BACT|nr:MAG: carbon starvation protein CstA [Candidatus Schekmanbacteria bacterium RIFCSPLOWO2_12_FULL_38_15]
MNGLTLVIAGLCILIIAYRLYGSFLAAKVATLNDSRLTPAHTFRDEKNFLPTNRWVLFGHHFASIAGAGPLIGPVLAAQFGYLPGTVWILIGGVIGGAVHDFIILFASVRCGGKSLAEIAKKEVGPVTGFATALAILFIIIIALAGLGLAVVNALKESPWSTFIIAMTTPIALFMGFYMHKLKPGHIKQATVIGIVLFAVTVIFGKWVPGSFLAPYFTFDPKEITIFIAIYGLTGSILPVWVLLAPRDYLCTFMKIGTIAFLAIGVTCVMPELKMPAITGFIHGGGPIIPGKVFPFVFITIACGAISGFHSLISSGTTPKMIDKESDIKLIGFGAMLAESFVALIAIIAACALEPSDYFAINVIPEKFKQMGLNIIHLPELEKVVGEQLSGRPGGAVSLAVGMAQIFSSIPGMKGLMSYWYHFAIMFEALFILTTVDTGTRVARFLLQEFGGNFYKPFGKADWLPGNLLASAVVVFCWSYFIYTGSISSIWPMFGIANQLLATLALCIGTTFIIRMGKAKYAWTTFLPMVFMTILTLTAGWQSIFDNFLPSTNPDKANSIALLLNSDVQSVIFQGYLNTAITAIMMALVVVIIFDSSVKWVRIFKGADVVAVSSEMEATKSNPKPDINC